MRSECAGVHGQCHALGVADRARQQRDRVADAAPHRGDRSASRIGSANPVGGTDHLELMPEPRHEAQRRERRVPDAVGHPQVLHHRAHELGPRRGEARDEREQQQRREAQRRGEADEVGGEGELPFADLHEHDGCRSTRFVDARRVDPHAEGHAEHEHGDRRAEHECERAARREPRSDEQQGHHEHDERERDREAPREHERHHERQRCGELRERIERMQESDAPCRALLGERVGRRGRRRNRPGGSRFACRGRAHAAASGAGGSWDIRLTPCHSGWFARPRVALASGGCRSPASSINGPASTSAVGPAPRMRPSRMTTMRFA